MVPASAILLNLKGGAVRSTNLLQVGRCQLEVLSVEALKVQIEWLHLRAGTLKDHVIFASCDKMRERSHFNDFLHLLWF